MTWNLTQTMSLIKAAQHKYTHRKLIGRDPKTNRARYRYYYARHHGGGITGAKFEAGSAFKLTWKGRRGHFHVDRVEGDKVFVKHDGRPGSKEVEMSRDELRALLEKQHSKAETKSREKAQANRRKGHKSAAKKRKSTKRQAPKTQTPREQLTETAQQGAGNFETMPEVETPPDVKRQRLERLKRMYTPNKKKVITPDKYVISFAHRSGGKDHYLISIGDPRKKGSKTVGLVQYKEGVQDWLSDNKNVNISENQIIDVSGLNLVSDKHTDDFMKMQAEIKKDIDRLQAEIDQSEAETAQQAPQRSQTAQAEDRADNFETMPEEPRNLKTAAPKKAAPKKAAPKKAAPKKAAPKKAAPQTPREQLIETTQPAQEAPETKQPVSDLSPVERMHKKGSPRAIGTRDLARKMDAVEQAIKGIEFTFKGKSFGLDSWQSRRHEDYGGGKIIKVKKNHKYLSGKVARRRIEVNAGELQDAMDFTRRGTGMARGVSVSTLSFNEANQFNVELKSTINAALERAMPGITDDRAGNFGFDYDGNYTADIRAGMVAAYIPQTAEQAKLAEDFSQLETLEAVKSLKNDEIEDEKTAYANTAAAAGHLRKELNEYPEYPKDPSTTYTERVEWKEGKKALEQRYILARDLSNRFFTLAQKRGTIQ